ncbi:MAG TPA: OmpA family protein [Anaeromyxobacteraceae bacterium]|nr:OmpA family protein [Anaeromyxobacteraceae bacterium]
MTRRPALLSVALLAACASGGKLLTKQEVIRQDIEKARKMGAERCAPKELALAEANANFATHDLALGQGSQAEDHLKVAEDNIRRAIDSSKECAPKQVTIGQAAPVPVIEKLEPKDTDGDGVPDDIDRCPLDPEDKDGFQDEDGCPDPDNDNDGIVDAMDACPNNPGPLSNRGCPVLDRDGDGVPDDQDKCPDEPGPAPDGCPKKYGLVVVKKDRIEIKQQVKYQTAKFKVLKASYPLLNQVVQVLNDYPNMRVRIEGHTDNVGGESHNLKLSQKRAESVRAYLIGKGIAADRLETAGYGLTRPIASNRTEKGRAQNRRTEFHIVSTGE